MGPASASDTTVSNSYTLAGRRSGTATDDSPCEQVRNNASVPEVWVARMLRSAGGVIAISAVLAVLADFSFDPPIVFYAVGSDLIGFAIGAVMFAWAASLSTRPCP